MPNCRSVRRQEALAKGEGHTALGEHWVLPLILHGDAAFAGQGLVSEVLQLSELPDFTTGGSVNIIINNQIG